jgi:hypothetical protein
MALFCLGLLLLGVQFLGDWVEHRKAVNDRKRMVENNKSLEGEN